MKENIDNSLATARSLVRTHVERRVRLSDTLIKKERPGNKLRSIGDSEVPGLRIYIHPSGSNIFYFAYKPKNQKNWVRYKLGNFNILNLPQARAKAKKYGAAILEGKDPVEIKRELKEELILAELIEQFYDKKFKRSYGYKNTTIKTVKTYFKCWILQKTNDPKIREIQKENPYNIQHKKLSTITKDDIKMLHSIVGLKAKSVADKIIDYLNVLFNYAIEENLLAKNPIRLKKKEKFGDKEDNRVLTEEQREMVLNYAYKIDKRTGKINYNYYAKKNLNLVACLVIVWWLLTGRRNNSEGTQIKWKQISFPQKKIFFEDSKVGQIEYAIGPRAMELLKVIKDERLTEGPLLWKEGTKDYVFPSYHYNKRNSKKAVCKTPYLSSAKKTWQRILKDLNIDYLPPKQCRHTFLTLLLKKTKNIMIVKKAAGHSQIKTTNRYAKILDEDVVSGLEGMDQVQEKESKVLEFKKS
jgi:integrase|tara:strand:- start:1688 stop:3094 length:1407 start_codon:yes stop_codon:yes gene_type:complete